MKKWEKKKHNKQTNACCWKKDRNTTRKNITHRLRKHPPPTMKYPSPPSSPAQPGGARQHSTNKKSHIHTDGHMAVHHRGRSFFFTGKNIHPPKHDVTRFYPHMLSGAPAEPATAALLRAREGTGRRVVASRPPRPCRCCCSACTIVGSGGGGGSWAFK